MKIAITNKNCVITSEFEKYVHAKAARLCRQLPRQLRSTTTFHFDFMQEDIQHNPRISCCAGVTVGGLFSCKVEESTFHMYAAIDIVSARLSKEIREHFMKIKPTQKKWITP